MHKEVEEGLDKLFGIEPQESQEKDWLPNRSMLSLYAGNVYVEKAYKDIKDLTILVSCASLPECTKGILFASESLRNVIYDLHDRLLEYHDIGSFVAFSSLWEPIWELKKVAEARSLHGVVFDCFEMFDAIRHARKGGEYIPIKSDDCVVDSNEGWHVADGAVDDGNAVAVAPIVNDKEMRHNFICMSPKENIYAWIESRDLFLPEGLTLSGKAINDEGDRGVYFTIHGHLLTLSFEGGETYYDSYVAEMLGWILKKLYLIKKCLGRILQNPICIRGNFSSLRKPFAILERNDSWFGDTQQWKDQLGVLRMCEMQLYGVYEDKQRWFDSKEEYNAYVENLDDFNYKAKFPISAIRLTTDFRVRPEIFEYRKSIKWLQNAQYSFTENTLEKAAARLLELQRGLKMPRHRQELLSKEGFAFGFFNGADDCTIQEDYYGESEI